MFGQKVMNFGRFSLAALACLILCSGAHAARREAPPKAAPAAVLPASVDLRPEFNKWGLTVRAQGERGTCSVFTTAAALEYELARRDGHGIPLSVEFLNWAANQGWGVNQGDGSFFRDCLRGFKYYGICPDVDMPYRQQFDPELAPSDAALADATAIWALGFEIHWIKFWNRQQGLSDGNLVEIKQVLAQGHPVAAGSSHSRLLVGYHDDPGEPGGGVFIARDSAAVRYTRLSYEYVKANLNDLFWVELPAKAPEKDARTARVTHVKG